MQFIAMLTATLIVFVFCCVVFFLKGRKDEGEPRLHSCGRGEDCRCHGSGLPLPTGDQGHDRTCHEAAVSEKSFDLLDLLEKAKKSEDRS